MCFEFTEPLEWRPVGAEKQGIRYGGEKCQGSLGCRCVCRRRRGVLSLLPSVCKRYCVSRLRFGDITLLLGFSKLWLTAVESSVIY